MPSINMKVSTLWKPMKSINVKVSTAWQTIQSGWVNVSGIWKQFYTSTVSPSIESQVLITKTIQSNYTYTLTGTNYHWIDYNTLTYYFERSIDTISWSTIATGSPTNPGTGSSNNQGPISLDNIYVTAGNNYFRYRVNAYNSSYSTSTNSISSYTTILGPYTPTISSVSITGTNGSYSATINWGSVTNASSYRVYFPDGNTYDTSSTSLTHSFSGSQSTSYGFQVRAFSGPLVSSACSGYYGDVSSVYNASTPANPTLSDPTGIYIYTYNPAGGGFEVRWNAVVNATSYSWIVQSTDGSYYNSGTTTTNSFTITGGTSGSYPNERSLGIPNNKTIQVFVMATASGYNQSNYVSMSPNYTTAGYPTRPSSYNYSTTSNSITLNSFAGGSSNHFAVLYKYSTIFSSYTYQGSSSIFSTFYTFNSLSPGSVYYLYVYGEELGVQNGSAIYYSSNEFTFVDYFVTQPTLPSGVVSTSLNAYSDSLGGTTRVLWTAVPSALPTQTFYFPVAVFRSPHGANAFTNIYQEFYRIDGSSLTSDPNHNTGYGSISSITGNITVSAGYDYVVGIYSYNNISPPYFTLLAASSIIVT